MRGHLVVLSRMGFEPFPWSSLTSDAPCLFLLLGKDLGAALVRVGGLVVAGDCHHAARLVHVRGALGWLSATGEMAGSDFCWQQAQLGLAPG